MKQTRKLRIVLLFGGVGAEHDISRKSASSSAEALMGEQDLMLVGITKNGALYLYTGTPEGILSGSWERESARLFPTSFVRLGEERGLLLGDTVVPVDVVFPVLHGDYGEDGRVQGWLDCAGLPYVGTSTLSGAVCQDKALTKILAQHLSIPTVPWCTLKPDVTFAEAKLQIRAVLKEEEYPLILKPTALGSSIGLFTAKDDLTLREALGNASGYGDILVEKYLLGLREVEVCFLGLDEGYYFPAEVNLPSSDTPYTYEKKYKQNLSAVRETPLPEKVRDTLIAYAKSLVRLLGIRDLARLDFFLTKEGEIYFNEINTFPGFSKESFYPLVCEKNGFDYKTLLFRLCEVAYGRHLR